MSNILNLQSFVLIYAAENINFDPCCDVLAKVLKLGLHKDARVYFLFPFEKPTFGSNCCSDRMRCFIACCLWPSLFVVCIFRDFSCRSLILPHLQFTQMPAMKVTHSLSTHPTWVCISPPRFLLQRVIHVTTAVLTACPRSIPKQNSITSRLYRFHSFRLTWQRHLVLLPSSVPTVLRFADVFSR